MYWALYDVPGRWHAGRAASVEVTLLDFRNDHRPDAVIREPRTVDRLAERLRWRRVRREVDVCIPWQWQVRFLDDGGRELLRLKVSAQGAYATNEDSAGLYYAAGAPLADLLSEETGMPGMEP
jgi:hypothetical protein